MITTRQLRKRQKWLWIASLAAVVALFALGGCTDEVGATKALKDAGLRPVKVGGYAAFSCNAVCSGWLKGKTVRFD